MFFIAGLAAGQTQQDTLNFNGQKVVKSDKQPFKNAVIYSDGKGLDVIQVNLAFADGGLLLGQQESPLESFILFPSKSTHLTPQDIKDIFTFIDSADLINRLKSK